VRFVRLLTALIAVVALGVTPSAFAQQMPSPGAWQPGPGAMGDNTYLGVVDAPSNSARISSSGPLTVSGWFVDTTAQGWAGADDMQVFLGAMDSGQRLVGGSVGLNRADVGAALGNAAWSASGWRAVVDASALPVGQATLSAYLHTPAKGWWAQQITVTVAPLTLGTTGELLAPAPAAQGPPPLLTVSSPASGEYVSTRSRSFAITGSARDPLNGPRGIDWVEVWLNGEANTDHATFLGNTDTATDGTWSINFDPDTFPPINSNLYVYAHSGVTGKQTLQVVHFYLADRTP
jgi:Bacterial Ig domain